MKTPTGGRAPPEDSLPEETDMRLFSSPAFDDHEEVTFFYDRASGLRALVAIHDRTLGPAMGGLRMWPYADDEAALTDVLRLSRSMTYKAAIAGLEVGGGKAVIIGDPRHDKSPALLHAFGRALDTLGGRYYTAEDVGTSPVDMDRIGEVTRYVLGRSSGRTGDPSPMTARGVWLGIRSAVRARLGRELDGVRVAVQGLGNVGFEVARLLHAAGAVLVVADLETARVARAVEAFAAQAVPVGEVLAMEAEVVAPCALGGAIDDLSIGRLRCQVVAGSANNQLLEARHGVELHRRGILYAPDYVINGGGIMAVSEELAPGRYAAERVERRVQSIGAVLDRIFAESARDGLPPEVIADRMARARLEAARRARSRGGILSAVEEPAA